MDYKTMNTEITRHKYSWTRIRNLDDMRFKAETWTDDIPGIEILISFILKKSGLFFDV